MSLLPVAVYGLQVPCGDLIVPAISEEQAQYPVRITMAAIDPTAAPSGDGETPRATLKILRMRSDLEDDDDDEEDDDDDIDAIRARLQGVVSDDEDDEEDSDDEEVNGGPSDPSKTKKARLEAAAKELVNTLKNGDDMDIDNVPNGINGISKDKGKGKATDLDELDDDDDDDDMDMEMEEFVVCTLDLTKNYQQPLDITITDSERVFFRVTGTHDIYLTGNFVMTAEDEDEDEDDDMDGSYGIAPYSDEMEDEDEYDTEDEEQEEDELDGLEDPRITEIESEEEVPQLVRASKKDKKGKNKRPAEESEEEPSTLDDLINKSLKPADATASGEQKLSKKQPKKLKNNAGQAVAAETPKDEVAKKERATGGAEKSPATAKSDKKVQFAKNLEQGPTPSPQVKKESAKTEAKKEEKKDEKPKASLGVKVVQGVKIDDKKLGSGPAAKKGDRIGMRYIGKLEKDGKVFDSNKKGKPFTFKLGVGEVIKGWDIGVAGMQVGGERRITIPASLGYGSRGAPPDIPPNANLVFDIKMLELK